MNMQTKLRVLGARLGGLLCLVLAGAVASCLVTNRKWDGGFPTVGFQFEFKDGNGAPVEGIELRVQDPKANPSFFYPISDYTKGHALSSGKEGILRFHHVSSRMEFSGESCRLFFVVPIGEARVPVYYLTFHYEGKEVYRCKFDEVLRSADWTHLRKTKLQWTWPSGSADRVRGFLDITDGQELEMPLIERVIQLGDSGDSLR